MDKRPDLSDGGLHFPLIESDCLRFSSPKKWSLMDKRPDLSDGGLHFPLNESDLLRFSSPKDAGVCSTVTPGVEQDNGAVDSDRFIMNLHANWGHASANQLKCFLADYDGGRSHLVTHMDGALASCEVCRAFDKAPHLPIEGTSSVFRFNEMVQVNL